MRQVVNYMSGAGKTILPADLCRAKKETLGHDLLCPLVIWREAECQGSFPGTGIDRRDGYIHFSTAGQLRETAARHFAGQEGLALVAVDETVLGPALKWEPARDGSFFPQLYGDLTLAAVRWAKPLPLGLWVQPLRPVAMILIAIPAADDCGSLQIPSPRSSSPSRRSRVSRSVGPYSHTSRKEMSNERHLVSECCDLSVVVG
jgi:uncharacterized protein (DUF952 family)